MSLLLSSPFYCLGLSAGALLAAPPPACMQPCMDLAIAACCRLVKHIRFSGQDCTIIMQVPATSRVSMGVSSMVLHKGVELVGMCVLPATLPTPQDVVSESETGALAALPLTVIWNVQDVLTLPRSCCFSKVCAQGKAGAPA